MDTYIIYTKDNINNFTIAEEIIYKSLKKKINITIINNIDTNHINEHIVCYKFKLNGYRTINHISELLYFILHNISCEYKRLNFLKDLFNNEDIVIIAPGPYLDKKRLNYLIDTFITISVKYATQYLFDNNMIPTFFIFNQWLANGNSVNDYDKYTNKVTSIYGKKRNSKSYGLINFNSSGNHKDSFKKISQHIDVFSWKQNHLYYNNAHIMLELSIPLCIHLGVKNIYTLGWDLDYSKKSYFTDKVKLLKNVNINNTEAHIVKDVVIILKKYGINIFKLNNDSPIHLEYIRL